MVMKRRAKPGSDGGEVIAIAHWRTTTPRFALPYQAFMLRSTGALSA
jgi:hypothetical protein